MCCAGSLMHQQPLGEQLRMVILETGSRIKTLGLPSVSVLNLLEQSKSLSDPSEVTWQPKEGLLGGLQFQISDKNLQSYSYHALLRNP